jgi:hypothetical protein
MKKESMEIVPQEETVATDLINKKGLDVAIQNQQLFREFVASQLKEGVDYGKIIQHQKPSLLKPGAEKLRMLFQFRTNMDCISKEINHEEKFCLYEYQCTVRNKAGEIISQCIGSANNREKKRENIPFYDALNPVAKMAQKRAFVGAVLLATNASDSFTQDLEDMDLSGQNLADYKPENPLCPECNQELRVSKSPRGPSDYYYCWAKMGGCGKTFPKDFQKVEVKISAPTDFAPSQDGSLDTSPVTKQHLDQLIQASKITGWTRSDLADASNHLFKIVQSIDLQVWQWSQLMNYVSQYTPEKFAEAVYGQQR